MDSLVKQVTPYLVVLGFAVAGLIGAYIVRGLVFPQLKRAAAHTTSTADDKAIAAVERPILLWGALIGAYVGIGTVPSFAPAAHGLQVAVQAVLLLSATWTLGRIAGDFVNARTADAELPSANLIANLARAGVLMIGALVLLQALDIKITPILTALGVGGLAVGLALQDTLANLFAGIQILISKQVRVGDFIRLSSSEEGFVTDITWRYTIVRELGNNFTIVPNSKLSSAVTSNFSLPQPEQSVSIQVGVSYDSDLEMVERVTIDVARQIQQTVDGAVRTHEPFTRYHTFGESSIDFSVILRGQEYTSQYLMKHEFIKALHARYKTEGIDIPFPIRTVYLKQT
ncbi:MAG: mechanosensitive ion channel domain-containing protein [Gemmatimonadaceae bacterium]